MCARSSTRSLVLAIDGPLGRQALNFMRRGCTFHPIYFRRCSGSTWLLPQTSYFGCVAFSTDADWICTSSVTSEHLPCKSATKLSRFVSWDFFGFLQ
eukprot:s1696_g2.t1